MAEHDYSWNVAITKFFIKETAMNSQGKRMWYACVLATLGVLSGCGGGSSGSGSGSGAGGGAADAPPQFGLLSVGMVDAHACALSQVNLTIAKLRVHPSSSASETDAGWTDITVPSGSKINLFNISDGLLDRRLGQVSLPVGTYGQMRLVLAENNALSPKSNSVLAAGSMSEQPLDVPGATVAGIRLTSPFTVKANAATDLTIDIDACSSVVTRSNGSYLFKPVANSVHMLMSGTIIGSVGTALAGSHPMITAQQDGVVIKMTTPDATGKFVLGPINEGNYDVVVTADGRSPVIIGGVPVTAENETMVATVGDPLDLPIATTANFGGIVKPYVSEADIKVTQSVAGGTTVQVASGLSSYSDGEFGMVLPSAPPMVGRYGTGGLPIVLLGDMTAAGKYGATISAAGYKTQLVAVDVSRLNSYMEFVLLP
jgi:hypothetical protein